MVREEEEEEEQEEQEAAACQGERETTERLYVSSSAAETSSNQTPFKNLLILASLSTPERTRMLFSPTSSSIIQMSPSIVTLQSHKYVDTPVGACLV